MKKKVFITFLLLTKILCARDEEEIQHPKQGNFAVDNSQQPGTLFGFGQNINSKGDLLGYVLIDQLKGKHKKFNEYVPGILYSLRDDFSLFLNVPVANFSINNERSHTVEDIFLQAEYAFYNKEKESYVNQATIVGTVYFPSGSSEGNAHTGMGATTFFIGATINHLDVEWYYFFSTGTWITRSHNNYKYGNIFLYQGGIGKNLWYKADSWVLTLLLECNGVYAQKDSHNHTKNQNSGGNVLFTGPSVFFSTQRLIIQAGITWPIAQHLFGEQNKNHYFAALNLGWKFN